MPGCGGTKGTKRQALALMILWYVNFVVFLFFIAQTSPVYRSSVLYEARVNDVSAAPSIVPQFLCNETMIGDEEELSNGVTRSLLRRDCEYWLNDVDCGDVIFAEFTFLSFFLDTPVEREVRSCNEGSLDIVAGVPPLDMCETLFALPTEPLLYESVTEYEDSSLAGGCIICNAGCTGYTSFTARLTDGDGEVVDVVLNSTYSECTVPVSTWEGLSLLYGVSRCDSEGGSLEESGWNIGRVLVGMESYLLFKEVVKILLWASFAIKLRGGVNETSLALRDALSRNVLMASMWMGQCGIDPQEGISRVLLTHTPGSIPAAILMVLEHIPLLIGVIAVWSAGYYAPFTSVVSFVLLIGIMAYGIWELTAVLPNPPKKYPTDVVAWHPSLERQASMNSVNRSGAPPSSSSSSSSSNLYPELGSNSSGGASSANVESPVATPDAPPPPTPRAPKTPRTPRS